MTQIVADYAEVVSADYADYADASAAAEGRLRGPLNPRETSPGAK